MTIPLVSQDKKSILVWSDSVVATTGFGRVAEHILAALHKTGRYTIDQLAINHNVGFFDVEKYPYCITPSKLRDPRDPYGKQAFLDALKTKDYDFVFVINDSFVVSKMGEKMEAIRQELLNTNRKPFKLVYYYPVDCHLRPEWAGMVRTADRAVAYTNFAADETEKVIGTRPHRVIYHGVDTENFFPIPDRERQLHREKFFDADDDTFIVVNINRNSLRKDVARTIYTFAQFHKRHPNSKLYLHMLPRDAGGGGYPVDLIPPIEEMGLEPNKDVFFPNNYDPSAGYPVAILNQLYNCADLYMSTHLGEGFGLTQFEAMAAGVPVLVPDNTVTPELVDGRGYVYPCRGITYVDGSGFRKQGLTEDIDEKLEEAYLDWEADSPQRNKYVEEGFKFVDKYSWGNVTRDWVRVFREAEGIKIKRSTDGESI
tara:strand:- start:12280 stop:13560 length:1281 start_codon:yes stop_codon:yes gene_type:complete